MKKRTIKLALLALVSYIVLLLALVYAESFSQDANITTFPQAVWYSLVTMTTVGYGDLSPVTGVGRVIGVLFLLLSAGALTAVIGLGVTWFTGRGYPGLRIRMAAKRPLYLFAGNCPQAQAFCDNIRKEQPEALCVFAGEENDGSASGGCISISAGVEETLHMAKRKGNTTVIFMGSGAEEEYFRLGDSLREMGVTVACESALKPDGLDTGLRLFDHNELCASMYWKNHPLPLTHQTVLLVGFDALGRQLLEHALCNGLLSPVRTVEYHVFGSADAFLGDHPMLGETVSLGTASEEKDSLFVHEEPWNASMELLQRADRILLCSDDQSQNVEHFRRLHTYFAVKAQVHVYASGGLAAELPVFGTDDEVYTAENVLRAGLETLAKEMNEVYRSSAGGNAPTWEELNAFLRRSNLASAEHLRVKLQYLLQADGKVELTRENLLKAYDKFCLLRQQGDDTCRKIEHDRWMRFHAMYNWAYAPVRDNAMRKHPLMVPFDCLARKEQEKDDYAWELLRTLAERM